MDEKEYGINWLGLFIKVIIFVIVVLLAIWLLSKIFRKEKGLSVEENITQFKDATVEYFKDNLPERRKKNTVTLNQLIYWNYIDELKNEKGKKCNKKDSKSTIEVEDEHYEIKTTLICGKEKETIYTKLGNEKCQDCDIKIEGLKEVETPKKEQTNNENKKEEIKLENSKGPSTNTEIKNNEQVTEPSKIILYEYVKETDEYSDWYNGKVTGANIENSTKKISLSKFCKENNCVTDTTDSKDNYVGYKIKDTWTDIIDIYRYKITIKEYKYSNAEYLEGYTKTGNTKVAE